MRSLIEVLKNQSNLSGLDEWWARVLLYVKNREKLSLDFEMQARMGLSIID